MMYYNFDYYQYKQKINKQKKYVLTILVCLLILLSFIFTYLKPNNYLEFYFVEINKFSDYQTALNYSLNKKQNENILCYIYFDNYYHILTNFYSDYDKAKLHCKENSSSNNEKIFTKTAPKFSQKKDLTTNQNELIKSIYLEFEKLNTFTTLDNDLNQQKISLDLKNFVNKFDDIVENFSQELKNFSILNSGRNSLLKIQNFLQSILDYSDTNFVSNLKFLFIQIALEEITFLNYF